MDWLNVVVAAIAVICGILVLIQRRQIAALEQRLDDLAERDWQAGNNASEPSWMRDIL